MITPLCICELIPSIDIKTRVIVLMHYRESVLPTNTGKLAILTLKNSELRFRGQPSSEQVTAEGLFHDDRTTLLLYPDSTAQSLTQEYVETLGRPINLIVPDGSWRQARKMGTREPALAGVSHVKLMPGPLSEYRLRREHKPEGLATFEAIARALGIIEGPGIQSQMEHVFRVMVERTLWSRGRIRAADCKFPLPPAAIAAHRGSSGTPHAQVV